MGGAVQMPSKRASGRWLICLELQVLHLPAHREAIDNARELLVHARRTGWPVVHIHFRPQMTGAATRPAPGCEPLPSEAVFFRDGMPTTPDHPFWDLVRKAEGSEALLCGVVSDPWSIRGIEAAGRIVRLGLVREAMGGTMPQDFAYRFEGVPMRRALDQPLPFTLEAANAP